MASTLFNTAQRIIKQILDWLETALESGLSNFITDYTQAGVVKNLLGEFTFSAGSNNTPTTPSITIGAGVAYDTSANRIFISSSDVTTYNASNPSITTNDGTGNLISTPQSTGCVNVPLTTNVINYVWINYLATIDPTQFTLNKVTNAKQFYKQEDGYNIRITTVNTPPDGSSLFLGQVNLTGSGTVSPTTISQAGRVYSRTVPYRVQVNTPQSNRSDVTTSYTFGQSLFVDDHVKAIGSGTPSATNPHGLTPADLGLSSSSTVQNHQQYFHTSGIEGSPASTNSSLFGYLTSVNPGFDFITVSGLSSAEEVNVNGVTITNTNLPIPTILNFSILDPTGTWYVYLSNVTLTIQRTQTNLVSTPDPTKLLLFSISYAITGSGPSTHGVLSNLVDYRQFGSISAQNVEDSLAAWIFSKIDEADSRFEVMTYDGSNNLLTYDLYGSDSSDHEETLLGQVTFTNGLTSVTGVGTDFQTRLTDTLEGISDQSKVFLAQVSSVTNNTNLTLVDPWAGATETVTAIRFKYHMHETFTYISDPVFIGTSELSASQETFRFGATTFVRNTTYTYDGSGNLVDITRE